METKNKEKELVRVELGSQQVWSFLPGKKTKKKKKKKWYLSENTAFGFF